MDRQYCEAFDPVKRTSEPLPEMAAKRPAPAAALVAGAMVVAGRGTVGLFDEESERWLALPHPMAEPRNTTHLISLPALALQAASPLEKLPRGALQNLMGPTSTPVYEPRQVHRLPAMGIRERMAAKKAAATAAKAAAESAEPGDAVGDEATGPFIDQWNFGAGGIDMGFEVMD